MDWALVLGDLLRASMKSAAMHFYCARSSFHVAEPQMRPTGDRLFNCANAYL